MPFQKVLEAVFLGFLQGITEFFPISSSGHIVLFQHIFGIKEPELFFTTVLHFATMMATVTFFRKDLLEIIRSSAKGERGGLDYLFNIVIVLIPTVLIGLIVAKQFVFIFASITVVRIAFIVTALILIVPSLWRLNSDGEVTKLRAFFIGAIQGISVIPGISRSGSTIVAGVISGVKTREAFKFSFIVSIPAIMAAMVLNVIDGSFSTTFSFLAITSGFFAAFFSGYASLAILKRVVMNMKLHIFGYYLVALFLASLILIK